MDDLADRLDRTPAPWLPEPGGRLVGRVVEVGQRESRFGGTYPVVAVLTDSGEELLVHAYHTVLKGELAAQRPRPGDRIGIKYLGPDSGRGYERYRVIVDRTGALGDPDPPWDHYAEEADQELAQPPEGGLSTSPHRGTT